MQVNGIDDVAIIRIEQLYPFPIAQYAEIIAQYGHAEEIVWCQEEPLRIRARGTRSSIACRNRWR